MSTAAMTLGAAFAAGVLLIVYGLRPRPRRAPAGNRVPRRTVRLPQSPERTMLIAGSGCVVLVITRWPVLAVAVGVAVWWLIKPESRSQASTVERTEALATWAEQLRDATGTPRGIEGVLVTTTDTAPLVIRPAVQRFADRLVYEPIETALPDLADDLNDPNGDLIVASLHLAATSGGRDIRSVLDDLARSARSEASMRRRVEVSRQRPRSEMRSVIVLVVALVVLMAVTNGSYLEAYDTPGGQVVLAVAAAIWAAGLVWMSRLGRLAPMRRLLTRRDLQ